MKKTYATTLCNGEGYTPGVEALGASLRASGTTESMVLMVTPEVSAPTRDRLASQGWILRDIQPIENPNPATQQMLPRFGAAYTKLRAWQLTDFDKVVFLDADTVVIRRIDDLFDRPELAAGPDFFLPDRFSSGVMVLDPSASTFDRMLAALSRSASYDGGDQGFLNVFFANWYGMSAEHRLPVGYNMPNFIYQFMHAHAGAWDTLEKEVKVLHYLVQKPWSARAVLTGASEVWWHAYLTLHPEKASSFRTRLHAIEDHSFDRLAHWFVG